MNERIEDILREMRNEDEIGKMISALPDGVRNDGSAEYLRSLADRIERAWEEEEQMLAMAAHLAGMRMGKEAINKPARNCDVLTRDEAKIAWNEYQHSKPIPRGGWCDRHVIDWLYTTKEDNK